MSVNIDTCSLRLFKKLSKVTQIMSADKYCRIIADTDINCSGLRVAIGSGVGLIKQCKSR